MAKSGDYVMEQIYGAHLKGVGDGQAKGQARSREMLIERMYLRILTEMCSNRFEWSGLPPEINKRFLELTMFRNAFALFWQHDDIGVEGMPGYVPGTGKFMATRGTVNGPLNFYDEPTRYRSFGLGLRPRTLYPQVTCVPIWANYLRIPDLDIVQIYAGRLANFDRTIEINARNARQNRLVAATENTRLTTSNINRQIEDGVQVITYNPESFDPSAITVLDMESHPDKLEKLHITKGRIWSEAMMYLGIDNANQDKKERLVEAEVDSNIEQIESMRIVNLRARQEACEQINSLFDLNVSVDYRVVKDAEEKEQQAQEQEAFNGNVHDGAQDSSGDAWE